MIGIGDAATHYGEDLIIDLVQPEMAEGLDDGPADPPGCGHSPRGGVLEDDFPFADPDLAGRAVGQESDAQDS